MATMGDFLTQDIRDGCAPALFFGETLSRKHSGCESKEYA